MEKLRAFFNHPAFIEATVERVGDALRAVPADARENVQIVYLAHSIPVSMANTSDYVKQLEEVRRLVSAALGQKNDALVYQSRSGAPGQPWLEPDILDYLRKVKAENLASAVVLAPIGFISDHMEVLYDLDIEARQLCDSLQLADDAGENCGRASEIYRHDSRADCGADESGVGAQGVGFARSSGGCLRRGLLSRAAENSGQWSVISGQT